METTNIYNLIILDESGSMESIKLAAINGCNETLQSIRSIQKKYKETQNHFVSLVSFNSENSTNIIFDKVPAAEARDVQIKDYNPNCCTPLYDAMGLSFTHLQNTLDKTKKTCVLATIITDGYENSSHVFNAAKIASFIDELKSSGWTFAYIGANQDVVAESSKLNIEDYLYFEVTERGSKEMFDRVNEVRLSVAKDIACDRPIGTGKLFEKTQRNR